MFLSRFILGLFLVFNIFCSGQVLAATKGHHRHHHAKKSELQVNSQVNINTASIAALSSLKGVGPKKAEAIIAYRNSHGDFKSIEDLTAVKGIGEKFIARLKSHNKGRIVV